MKEKIKVIDLLVKISKGEEVPNHIRYAGIDLYYNKKNNCYDLIMSNVREEFYTFSYSDLNNEVEIIEDEEDKDIPLIPDDELWEIENNDATNYRLNYNFKVLTEKINQVVEEFNEYRKENEENEKQKEKKQRNGI